jgi:nucleotide-binding universal stress UspA family protein
MSYKTILVHAADEKRFANVLAPALVIARNNNAHITALSVLPPVIVDPALAPGGVATIIDSHRRAYDQQRSRMRPYFEDAVRQAGVLGEWINADANRTGVWNRIVDYGRSADLIVASQAKSDWAFSELVEAPIEIVMNSGRPLLLIPNTGQHTGLGKRVLIGWNGRREAARAAFDALPILKGAEIVRILWVNPEDESEEAGEFPSSDLSIGLARHGVNCMATDTSQKPGNVGSTLLSYAHDTSCDLLVMGCYGHSRVREFVVGGVTRYVLKHAKIPVLLSH